MSTSSELLKQLAREVSMLPQEQTLAVGRSKKRLQVGIPKEVTPQEHRVPLTPASVAVLSGRGHEVIVQRGVGSSVQFQDSDYSEAGAQLVDSAREVFAAAGHDPERVQPISTQELQPPRPAPRPANSVLDNLAWRLHGFGASRDFREPLAELVARLGA